MRAGSAVESGADVGVFRYGWVVAIDGWRKFRDVRGTDGGGRPLYCTDTIGRAGQFVRTACKVGCGGPTGGWFVLQLALPGRWQSRPGFSTQPDGTFRGAVPGSGR